MRHLRRHVIVENLIYRLLLWRFLLFFNHLPLLLPLDLLPGGLRSDGPQRVMPVVAGYYGFLQLIVDLVIFIRCRVGLLLIVGVVPVWEEFLQHR